MVDFTKIPRAAEVNAIREECRRDVDNALPEDEPDTIPDWCYDSIIRTTLRVARRLAPRIFDKEPEPERTFYATVTISQYPALLHPRDFAGAYVEIRDCANIAEAESKMFSAFGRKWSFMYTKLEKIHPLDRNCIAILT